MTVTCEPAFAPSPTYLVQRCAQLTGRLIGVGVRDHLHDVATIDWAVADAVGRMDTLHVVHAFIPLRLDGCAWEPVARARDSRYLAARRVVAQSIQRAAAGHAELVCDGSAIAGLPEDVLVELSQIVDLIVIGDDSACSEAPRKITWRIQDRARCPVVCVPLHDLSGAEARPVTVVADERGLPEAALGFGAEAATRHGVGLEVSRTWSSLHEEPGPGPAWLAAQQERLDAQLAGWRQRYPHLPVAGRIELDDDWPTNLRRGSGLLVVPSYAAPLFRSGPIDRLRGSCPVAVVPEGHEGRARV